MIARLLGSVVASLEHFFCLPTLPGQEWIWRFLKDHGLKDDWICLFCEGIYKMEE